VVAEGVETEEQLNLLRKLGCDTIQGYYFSKPIPSNEVVMLLFKIMKGGGRTGPGGAQDIESTQQMAVPAELRPPKPPVPDIEKTQKIALASIDLQKPAAEPKPVAPASAPSPAPAEPKPELAPFEFKIELPPDLPAQNDPPKAKEA
jgi:hypothetical protein